MGGVLKKACIKKTCLLLAKEKPSKSKGKGLEEQEQVLAEINIENIPVTEVNFVSSPAAVKARSPVNSGKSTQPYHVRKLGFSNSKDGPTVKTMSKFVPASGSVKTLSPQTEASPIKRTDSSWNTDVVSMFKPDAINQ